MFGFSFEGGGASVRVLFIHHMDSLDNVKMIGQYHNIPFSNTLRRPMRTFLPENMETE